MEKLEQLYEGKAKILHKTSDPDLLIQYFKDDASAFDAVSYTHLTLPTNREV